MNHDSDTEMDCDESDDTGFDDDNVLCVDLSGHSKSRRPDVHSNLGSAASTSSLVVEDTFDRRTGNDFLRCSLLGKSVTGICTSPFYDNLECLQQLLAIHGILSHVYSEIP